MLPRPNGVGWLGLAATRSMLSAPLKFWRFGTGLHRFLRRTLTPEDCRRICRATLWHREDSFLQLLQRAVYQRPSSPYRALLEWAGAEYGDVEGMVRRDGLEAALAELYDAGVHISLEEFKGRCELVRPGLRLRPRSDDFSNPLITGAVPTASGGSTGPRQRGSFDFDLLVSEAANVKLMLMANGADDAPLSIWRTIPPGSAGLKQALQAAKFGNPMQAWFTPQPLRWWGAEIKPALFTSFAVATARGALPKPRFVSLSDGAEVARWIAAQVRAGRPALLSAPANSVARVCIAAKAHGLDISRTIFLVTGEPYTEAKRELVEELGARSVSAWAMTECGTVGLGCADREVVDEVHLMRGKIAVLQRARRWGDSAARVDTLLLTGLTHTTPKIMLNVDVGDYGVLRERRCACPLGELGYTQTLHTIRNYEKLTTGGMNFLGSSVIRLVEEVLPRTHGGAPSDYQLIDDQQGALNRIRIVVSPRVGAVDERSVVDSVLRFMAAESDAARMMGELWQQGELLSVSREEPHTTAASKIPQLHVLRGDP